jgi:tetratricopeptide (TPR) repeat protein
MNGLLLFIVIMILVILLYSFQSFFQTLGNNTNAFAISKELEYDDSSIIQISSITETETKTELQQGPCPEGFFINQTTNKCQERQSTPTPTIETAEEYFNEGNEQFQRGNYEQAIKNLDRAIEIDPNLAFAYSNKGLTLYIL